MPIGNKRGIEIFTKAGALVHGHFRLASGLDGTDYVAKNVLTEKGNEEYFEEICQNMANDLLGFQVQTVICPESGAVKYADRVAEILSQMTERNIAAVHAEKCGEKNDQFCFKDEDLVHIRGKRRTILGDVVTSGGSVYKVVLLTEETDGEVVVVTVIWNRNEIKATDIGARRLISQIDEKLPAYRPGMDCPGCKADMHYHPTLGHGKNLPPEHPLAPLPQK